MTSKRLQATNTWVLIEPLESLPLELAKKLVFEDFSYHLSPATCQGMWEYMDGDFSYTSLKGKLITRLEKAYLAINGKDEARYRFFDSMRYSVEVLISQYRTPALYYNLTDNLRWERNEYNDGDSCMFNEYPYARAVLVKYGALALVTRHAYQNGDGTYRHGSGMGRCWVIPLESGNFYMRNYNGMTQQQMTEIMRIHLERIGTPLHRVVDRTVDIQCYLSDGSQVYCYDNGNTIHLQTEAGVVARYESTKLAVEPCYCCAAAKHDNQVPHHERKQLPVCTLCPWKYELLNGAVDFDFDPDGEAYDDDYDDDDSGW